MSAGCGWSAAARLDITCVQAGLMVERWKSLLGVCVRISFVRSQRLIKDAGSSLAWHRRGTCINVGRS